MKTFADTQEVVEIALTAILDRLENGAPLTDAECKIFSTLLLAHRDGMPASVDIEELEKRVSTLESAVELRKAARPY